MPELTFSDRYLLALTYARNNVDSTVNNLIRNNLKPIKAKTTIVSQIFSSFSVVSDRVHFNVLITSLVIIFSLIVSFSCHQLVAIFCVYSYLEQTLLLGVDISWRFDILLNESMSQIYLLDFILSAIALCYSFVLPWPWLSCMKLIILIW